MNRTYQLLWIVLLVNLAGCASNTNTFIKGIQNAAAVIWGGEPRVDNPNFSYLRIKINDGHVAILARGAIESGPDGDVEIWYSADLANLRLRNGRVAEVSGFTSEWRRVVLLNAPTWKEAVRSRGDLHWMRVRDVMPDYQIGVRDEMTLRSIPSPTDSALERVNPKSLTWFEETVRSGVLPPARYAVDLSSEHPVVIYGEQCLSTKLCLSWQRWAATPLAE